MCKTLLTVGRVRTILSDARTEADAAAILREHRIRFSFSTSGGVFHIRIPARSGVVTVTRTASRSCPFRIAAGMPTPPPFRPWPNV